ncbi:MAG: SufD family Fe-S cluster assembly protein [Lachnospiraceae bacterium]|nr:SufD family Fe-S cluster assembly protein [Lachnospiraceae bacterium]
MKKMKLNNLPTLTWNFLKLNHAEEQITVKGDDDFSGVSVNIKNNPEGISITEEPKAGADIPGGMGAEAEELFKSVRARELYIHVLKGVKAEEPLRIDLDYSDCESGAVKVRVEAEEDSKVNIILNQLGQREGKGFACFSFKADIQSGASLKLVNSNLLGRDYTYFENIGARAADRALFGLIQMELGTKKTYVGVNVDLAGYKSGFDGDTGYLVRGDELLDMNYVINHIGRKSQSSLMAKGALKDRAVKNFRGTIDLRRGAKGAVGDEQEETLLLSEGVKNKTLPIILCDEEDVEGTHGASIGRLSEEVLFYMTSRGISEAEAELLMTRAKLDSIRRLIDDEESQGRIQHYLETNL